MKRITAALLATLCLVLGAKLHAQQPVPGRVVTTGLAGPWEIAWGPDNYLWVTERIGLLATAKRRHVSGKAAFRPRGFLEAVT